MNRLLELFFSLYGTLECTVCGNTVAVNTSCKVCGSRHGEYVPSAFSPNSSIGMCFQCYGRGVISHVDEKSIFEKLMLSKASLYNDTNRNLKQELLRYAKLAGFDANLPYSKQSPAIQRDYLYGSNEFYFIGYIPYINQIYAQKDIEDWAETTVCPGCEGSGLAPEVLKVKVLNHHISYLKSISVKELYGILTEAAEHGHDERSVQLAELMCRKLLHLLDVGLSYLSLQRRIPTLSGGELQRLYLASFFDIELNEIMYVFDEPTVGLHEIEKDKVINKLLKLKEAGNTVIVVEHDHMMLRAAEHIIEFGPGGGQEGGQILFQGNYEQFISCKESVISQYIAKEQVQRLLRRRDLIITADTPRLSLYGVNTNNLKDIHVAIPLGTMVGVAGVSGSGKSSLITDTLVPALQEHLSKGRKSVAGSTHLDGAEHIRKCHLVEQKPIGRAKTSIPASYIGVWDLIRQAFSKQAIDQGEHYTEGDFSFNSRGACQQCRGDGIVEIARFSHVCPSCEGKRFKPEILQIRYQGYTISDVLRMTVQEASGVFVHDPKIARILLTMVNVGLGYIALGQPITTISGGEAQRIKLTKELADHKHTGQLFVLDEPTSGLSYHDIGKLLTLLNELVGRGNSVIVIEHDALFLSCCDWILELGPGSGEQGGSIIAEGTPEMLVHNPHSVIGSFLYLN
ncbi:MULTISPECIES: ABC transporter [unclassified Paenibacillus]|uniref:ABC transporter n=1 Tax=unclassified Paenibacillus TaxID=185978 RepID=UPI00138E25D0|nr:ABC transporter [Paenibacillus sp. FSL R7-277]